MTCEGEGGSLIELFRHRPTDEAVEAWFVSRHRPDGVHCSHCGPSNVKTGAKDCETNAVRAKVVQGTDKETYKASPTHGPAGATLCTDRRRIAHARPSQGANSSFGTGSGMLSSTTIFPFMAPKRRLPLGLQETRRTTGAVAGDDNLFAGFRLGQQAGRPCFGFVDVDDGHAGPLRTYQPRE